MTFTGEKKKGLGQAQASKTILPVCLHSICMCRLWDSPAAVSSELTWQKCYNCNLKSMAKNLPSASSQLIAKTSVKNSNFFLKRLLVVALLGKDWEGG